MSLTEIGTPAPVKRGYRLFAYAVAAPVERFRANRERFIRAARSAACLAQEGLTETAGGDDSASLTGRNLRKPVNPM